MIDSIISTAKLIGVSNFVMLMSSVSILYLSIALNKNTKTNKNINDRFNKIIEALGNINKTLKDRLDMMFDIVKGKVMGVEETISLFYDIASSHAAEKIKYYRKILEEDDLYGREKQLKVNIKIELERFTNKSVDKLIRYNSIIPDLYNVIFSVIDMDEIYNESFGVIFDREMTNIQKLRTFDCFMNRWFLRIEKAIRAKASELGIK